jgi:flagellar biosynthesis protein FliR
MPDATCRARAMMFGEFMIGACIGFIAGLPLIAMEMAGHLMGHQMALSLAEVFNPELGSNMNAVGSLLFYMGISAFVLIGGPETCS